jgi:hypothetical protein
MKSRKSLVGVIVAATAVSGVPLTLAPRADAAPAPEVEYVYNVIVRRHYDFPNNDALTYGHGICDKVGRGEGYGQIMGDVKSDVTPSDEFAANYLVSYAVNLLCRPDMAAAELSRWLPTTGRSRRARHLLLRPSSVLTQALAVLALDVMFDRHAQTVITYSTLMIRNRRELSGSCRRVQTANHLWHNRRQGFTGTVQDYGSLIRWSRVRVPPAPRQTHLRRYISRSVSGSHRFFIVYADRALQQVGYQRRRDRGVVGGAAATGGRGLGRLFALAAVVRGNHGDVDQAPSHLHLQTQKYARVVERHILETSPGVADNFDAVIAIPQRERVTEVIGRPVANSGGFRSRRVIFIDGARPLLG